MDKHELAQGLLNVIEDGLKSKGYSIERDCADGATLGWDDNVVRVIGDKELDADITVVEGEDGIFVEIIDGDHNSLATIMVNEVTLNEIIKNLPREHAGRGQ